MFKRYVPILSIWSLNLIFCIAFGQPPSIQGPYSIAAFLEWKGVAISEEDYSIWGTSPIRDEYSSDPKFERPKILTINEKPAYLYAPSGWNVLGGKRTVSYVLKINLPEQKNTAITAVPSRENRAAAAGWLQGGTWMDQHHDINQISNRGDIDIVFLGNSITQSWGGGERKVGSVGGQVWQQYYGRRKAANFGISGDRTQHILWRIENGNFDTIEPKLIILLVGTNNLVDNTADEIIRGINSIIDKLRA